MNIADYIVVGSGCSGAMAAQTLVESGAHVLMIDVGTTASQAVKSIPDDTYVGLRQNDPDQYKYFIGEKGEGIGWGELSKGAQVTPPRQYMTRDIDTLIPMVSDTFKPLESLGYGGLGIGWGLQCWEYSDADLTRTGLDTRTIRKSYETVAGRIGISATRDDAAQYTIGELNTFQPSATADRNHQYIQDIYTKKRDSFQKQGYYVGRTPLALITQDTNDRLGYKYRDMDFYSDQDRSAWRPPITVDALKKLPNFTYLSGLLVLSFIEENEVTVVHCRDISSNQNTVFRCKKLLLGSGALGTARIVLRSLGDSSTKLSILSNPHSYIPCIQPKMLGKGVESKKLGLGQLSYFIDHKGTDDGLSVASSYSYQSLMSLRIVTQMPLNFGDARLISQYILPSIVITIVQHPDSIAASKHVSLASDPTTKTGDALHVKYVATESDIHTRTTRELEYTRLLRKLHTFPLKRVDPGHGSGIHYAGTLPYDNTGKAFTLAPSGRLNGTRNVYVIDSSGFKYLPAKGLTFTLMANAHAVTKGILHG